jgi:hypothetical protein
MGGMDVSGRTVLPPLKPPLKYRCTWNLFLPKRFRWDWTLFRWKSRNAFTNDRFNNSDMNEKAVK